MNWTLTVEYTIRLHCLAPSPRACITSCWLSNRLIFHHPLLLLPSIFPSVRVFSNESALPIRWPKYWSLNFSISPSSEQSGLIPSGSTGLFSLLSKGLSSLLQPHSSKEPILQCSSFLMVQLSHPYMTTGKTIALTIRSFVNKVMSLLFNMLSKFVIAFLSKNQQLLILSLEHKMVKIMIPCDLHILVKIMTPCDLHMTPCGCTFWLFDKTLNYIHYKMG